MFCALANDVDFSTADTSSFCLSVNVCADDNSLPGVSFFVCAVDSCLHALFHLSSLDSDLFEGA